MLTSGCPSDFHHVQTTALHAHIQWSTACTHLVVHRMHTSSGPPDAAHPVVHRMRHIRWTTSGTFPDAWGCDIRWSTGGQPVDHRMWRSPVYWSHRIASSFRGRWARAYCMKEISCKQLCWFPGCASKSNLDFVPSLVAFGIRNSCFFSGFILRLASSNMCLKKKKKTKKKTKQTNKQTKQNKKKNLHRAWCGKYIRHVHMDPIHNQEDDPPQNIFPQWPVIRLPVQMTFSNRISTVTRDSSPCANGIWKCMLWKTCHKILKWTKQFYFT